MRVLVVLAALTWGGLWLTPDQRGRRHFQRDEFVEAAESFRDPLWQGAAWFRAGEFERAAGAFARRESAEACFNEGNARLMLGKYEAAIACYDRALARRPGWPEAQDNRDLAAARAAALDFQGGDTTGGELEADGFVFGDEPGDAGESTEVAGGKPLSDQEIQALWLRRVQTRPADFLRSKFAYQEALRIQGDGR